MLHAMRMCSWFPYINARIEIEVWSSGSSWSVVLAVVWMCHWFSLPSSKYRHTNLMMEIHSICDAGWEDDVQLWRFLLYTYQNIGIVVQIHWACDVLRVDNVQLTFLHSSTYCQRNVLVQIHSLFDTLDSGVCRGFVRTDALIWIGVFSSKFS